MVFAISNQKGGVGKTTTAINLGVYLAKKGKKVLCIDLDPQANLTSGLGFHNDENSKPLKTIYSILLGEAKFSEVFLSTNNPNLFLAPSGIDLAGVEVELVNAISRESILKNAIKEIKNQFDFVLIDCPPSLGILTVNALNAADKVLIPVQCEYFALEGLSQLLNTINLVKNKLNGKLEIGAVILTMFDSRTNLSKQVADEVRNFFKEKVLKTAIPRNVRLSEAPSYGKSIYEYDSSSSGASAYEQLAQEIITTFCK